MILPEEFKGVAFLQELGRAYVDQRAFLAQSKEVEEGAVIFPEGVAWPHIYIVLDGEVGLEVEEPHGLSAQVNIAGPGDLLGWSPLLGRRAMTATARALTRCRLAAYTVKQIQDLSERDLYFGKAFLRQIASVTSDRLHGTRRQLARAVRHQLPQAAVAEGSD